MKIHDLSLTIETGMPTCGTPWHQTVEITQMGRLDEVGRNTHRIVLGSHSGTHMDAPFHFIDGGMTMEGIDPYLMWGPALAVDFRDKGAGDTVTLSDVEKLDVSERMIFLFGWYHNWKTDRYYKDFPYFETDAVKYLLDKGMKVMAMDTPSPDNGGAIREGGKTDSPNHVLLLEKGVFIIEYLNNTDVLSGGKVYELVAAPLKVKGSDGSPGRVLVRED
ncbi:MAG: cyclase family protein [Lachnospiraceae bacterium]|nr:cyclase family protein [Lachnospiraceae bacterium]